MRESRARSLSRAPRPAVCVCEELLKTEKDKTEICRAQSKTRDTWRRERTARTTEQDGTPGEPPTHREIVHSVERVSGATGKAQGAPRGPMLHSL